MCTSACAPLPVRLCSALIDDNGLSKNNSDRKSNSRNVRHLEDQNETDKKWLAARRKCLDLALRVLVCFGRSPPSARTSFPAAPGCRSRVAGRAQGSQRGGDAESSCPSKSPPRCQTQSSPWLQGSKTALRKMEIWSGERRMARLHEVPQVVAGLDGAHPQLGGCLAVRL